MRIGLDLTSLLPVETGVERYQLQLVSSLARQDGDTRFVVFANWPDLPRLAPLCGRNFTVVPVSLRSRIVRLFAQQLLIPALALRWRLEVLHSPSFLLPWGRMGGVRRLLTVFDMTMFSRPHSHTRLRRSRAFLAAVAGSILRADMIHVPSNCVRCELLRLLPDVDPARVRVVPLGVDGRFSPEPAVRHGRVTTVPGTAAEARPPRADRPYILFVGTLQPRKNIETLLRAYRQAASRGCREDLVIAGQLGWGWAPVARLAASDPLLRERVRFAGYVPEEQLPALYRGARLFVFPSLEEGFGLPPLEAMACGVPCVCADTSSLRENLAGAAVLVPPEDTDGWADALGGVLRDPSELARLRAAGLARARGFSWESTARRTLDCYRELSAHLAGAVAGAAEVGGQLAGGVTRGQ